MEVVPFAWCIARAVRRAAEWREAGDRGTGRTRGRAIELVALAAAAPLLRPEGALFALFVAVTLAVFPAPGERVRERRPAIAAFAVIALPWLMTLATTGSLRSTTAAVKLLVGNPYYTGGTLVGQIGENARVLVVTLLNGEVWSAEFLPHGGAPLALAGLLAIAYRGGRADARWRAAGVLLLALAIFVPCAYVTFLWNRLRYLWPFAPAWVVGLACLARAAGDVLVQIPFVPARWRIVTPLACGAAVGALALRLDWTIDDVASSASGIERQHVTLGKWVKDNLPENARVGVNDTGAIAYFGDRATFDIVGLTSRSEGRYWVAGAASRLEHYERLYRESPGTLPTHFVVYPEWMGCDAVLGESLFEATVLDSTILGGQTMRVFVADYAKLGSGERPWSPAGAIVDALDVADLESEATHGYALAGAHDGAQIAADGRAPNGDLVIDGGRADRMLESFSARLAGASRGIVRLQASIPTRVKVTLDGTDAATLAIAPGEWTEASFPLDVRTAEAKTHVQLVSDAPVTVFHYWFVRGVE
jgi:hypothetical protein